MPVPAPVPATRRLLVVEDEPLFALQLRVGLEKAGYEVIGPVATAAEAEALFAATHPDLALLDIALRGPLDGIALAARLLAQRPLPLVFVTASQDDETYARAKAVGPFAFLTKPFDDRAVSRAVDLALHAFDGLGSGSPAEITLPSSETFTPDALFLRDRGRLVRVALAEVVAAEADANHTLLHTADGRRYALRRPLRDVGEQLAGAAFVQVHRSWLVNVATVVEVDPAEGVVLAGPLSVPLGQSYRPELLRRLQRLD